MLHLKHARSLAFACTLVSGQSVADAQQCWYEWQSSGRTTEGSSTFDGRALLQLDASYFNDYPTGYHEEFYVSLISGSFQSSGSLELFQRCDPNDDSKGWCTANIPLVHVDMNTPVAIIRMNLHPDGPVVQWYMVQFYSDAPGRAWVGSIRLNRGLICSQ